MPKGRKTIATREEEVEEPTEEPGREDEWEIESIIKKRMITKGATTGLHYFVKWKNYENDREDHQANWVHKDNMNCDDLLDEFNKRGMETEDEAAGEAPGSDNDSIPEDQWEVEEIVGRRKKRGGRTYEYLIKWKNCPESQNTWEPQNNLNCSELLEMYNREHPMASPTAKGRGRGPNVNKSLRSGTRNTKVESQGSYESPERSSVSEDQNIAAEENGKARKAGGVRGRKVAAQKQVARRTEAGKTERSPEKVLGEFLQDWPDSDNRPTSSKSKPAKSSGSTKTATAKPSGSKSAVPKKDAEHAVKKPAKREHSPEIEQDQDGIKTKEYTKAVRVRIMDGPVVTGFKTVRFNPDTLGPKKLQYNGASLADPNEGVTVIGRMRSIVGKFNFYICIQKETPDEYHGLNRSDMEQRFPKTLESVDTGVDKKRGAKKPKRGIDFDEEDDGMAKGIEEFYSEED